MKSNYEPLGKHIRLVDYRNSEEVTSTVLGISIDKEFMRQPRLAEDQNERPAHKISSPRRSRAHRRGPAEGISKQKTSADGRRFFCYVMSPSVKRRTGASASSVCVQTQAT